MILWPLVLYFVLVLVIVGGMLGLSYVLGQRHHEPSTDTPYESGIVPEGSVNVRVSAQFFLVAIFFVVFDLEAVFLFAWAVAVRELGWVGYGAAVVFVVTLFVALAYVWRMGALNWNRSKRKR